MARLTKERAWSQFWDELEHICELSTSLEYRNTHLEEMIKKIEGMQEAGSLSIDHINTLEGLVLAAYKCGATDQRDGRDTAI